MSRHVAKLVYDRKIGSMLRKAVLAYFAERANDDGSMIWASKKTIADEIECSKQAVINTVKQFLAEGILRENGFRKTQGGFTHIYDMDLVKIAALPKAKQSTELTGQNIDQSTPLAEPVNPVDPDQSTPLTQTVLEPSIEPSNDCASGDALKPEHIFEEWNNLAERIAKPKARDLTPERRQLIRARIAQYDIDDFVNVFGRIERSEFLRGDKGWRGCTFDWVLKKQNFQKILEGNYDG